MTPLPTPQPHRLYQGPAMQVCHNLPASTELDLVYLDPPYASGGHMATRDEKGQGRGRNPEQPGRMAYADPPNVEVLIRMLEDTLACIRERMSPHGCLYLHLDHRAVHEAKFACDRVFGRQAFAGEVIWCPGNGGRGRAAFAVTHQTLLVYARKHKRKLLFRHDHPLLREPFAATSLRMHFKKKDQDGRHYRERTVNGKTYRYYADEGRKLGSVWTDIPAMVANTPLTKEGTGYPTQKPEKLLERILRASSADTATVADFMCGSGTTLAVAARLGRRFIGGDQSPVAIDVCRQRLDQAGVDYAFERLEAPPTPDANCAASSNAATIPDASARPVPAAS